LRFTKHPTKRTSKHRQRDRELRTRVRRQLRRSFYLDLNLDLSLELCPSLYRELLTKSYRSLFRQLSATLFGSMFGSKYEQLHVWMDPALFRRRQGGRRSVGRGVGGGIVVGNVPTTTYRWTPIPIPTHVSGPHCPAEFYDVVEWTARQKDGTSGSREGS